MKKKKQNPNPIEDQNPSPPLDLKSLIHNHSLFFDKLVELIPARFYLPVEDSEKPWFQGLSKVAKASAKKETKENIKKSRKARFDPATSSTTTLDLLHKTLEKPEEEAEHGLDGVKRVDNSSVTYEELRQRLRNKIESLRSDRHAGDDDLSNRAKKREIQLGKRKRYQEENPKPKTKTKAENVEKTEAEIEKATEGMTFTHVKMGGEEERGKKRKKMTKEKMLEQARKLEEAKKENPEVAKKESLKAAMSRAAGVKVHDDPKLVNKSIKKEKKRHEKNVEKWKERVESTEKTRAERQKGRAENINERIKQKKARKIAKREKKLMRPGFEGRKEGYINGGAS